MKRIILLTIIFFGANFAVFSQQDTLQTCRKKIDSLDVQLIRILGERMEVVTAIGRYKAAHQIAALQPKRFEEILRKNILLGQEKQLSEPFIRALMEAIHQESLLKENALKNQ